MSVSQAVQNPRGYVVRTAGMYRALLFDPEGFYEDYVGERGIRSELVVVLFMGLVGFAGHYYARSQLVTIAEEAGVAIGNETNFNLWGIAIEPLVGIFLLWVGFSAVLFALSWLYSTVGTYYQVLKNVAWALVPLFVFNLLNSVALAYSAFTLQESDITDRTIPRAPQQKTTILWDVVTGEVFVVATVIVGALLTLWCGYIALHAVEDVRKLQRRDAYIVVGIPTLGFAIYLVYDAVTTLI
jgi:hypothetical protein